jgi:ADP-ribose pyrophosphatase YjhB (NUDIX family)
VRSGKMWNRNDEVPEGYYRLVVHACLFKEGKMLIQQKGPLKKNKDKWDITAGGGALYGENSSEAATRELFEETGIQWFFQLEPPHLTLNYGNVINDVYVLGTPKMIILGNQFDGVNFTIEDAKTNEKTIVTFEEILKEFE